MLWETKVIKVVASDLELFSFNWEPKLSHVKSLSTVSQPRVNKYRFNLPVIFQGTRRFKFIIEGRKLPGVAEFGNQGGEYCHDL